MTDEEKKARLEELKAKNDSTEELTDDEKTELAALKDELEPDKLDNENGGGDTGGAMPASA